MELKELNYLICSILFDLTMIFTKTIFFRENQTDSLIIIFAAVLNFYCYTLKGKWF